MKRDMLLPMEPKSLFNKNTISANLKNKVKQYIVSCVPCILTNRKEGKQERHLHPTPKSDVPLYTYHADHLSPLDTTCKNYNDIFVVIDSFTWLYPTKSTTTSEVVNRLELQKQVFGNPPHKL